MRRQAPPSRARQPAQSRPDHYPLGAPIPTAVTGTQEAMFPKIETLSSLSASRRHPNSTTKRGGILFTTKNAVRTKKTPETAPGVTHRQAMMGFSENQHIIPTTFRGHRSRAKQPPQPSRGTSEDPIGKLVAAQTANNRNNPPHPQLGIYSSIDYYHLPF